MTERAAVKELFNIIKAEMENFGNWESVAEAILAAGYVKVTPEKIRAAEQMAEALRGIKELTNGYTEMPKDLIRASIDAALAAYEGNTEKGVAQ